MVNNTINATITGGSGDDPLGGRTGGVLLPAVEGDQLLLHAFSELREFNIEGISTFVIAPEYLAAIALKVGRPEKDVPRLQQFFREK